MAFMTWSTARPWSCGCSGGFATSASCPSVAAALRYDRDVQDFTTITVERRGAVARLTLSRPERANALNAAMLGEINTALDALDRDGDVRVLIVTGAGAAFSSGFDLKEQMERRPAGVEQWRAILRKDFDTIMRFWHFPR